MYNKLCSHGPLAHAGVRLAALAAASMLAAAPRAKAGPDDAALLAQVKQLASQGQNAQTAAQISQTVDQNQDAISAILNMYMNYLKQVQSMSADDGSGTPPQPQTAPAKPAGTAQNAGGGNAAPPAATGGGASASASGGGSQASSGLQTSSLQPSGGLTTSHLAGYPALPDVEPASSVNQMTPAQMEYSAQVEKDLQARKQYLMLHPEGYTY